MSKSASRHLAPRAPRTDNAGPLALTMGEPAGIGGEIALKAWTRRTENVPSFFVIDDPARLEKLAEDLDLEAPIEAIGDPGQTAGVFASALPVMESPEAFPLPVDPVPGAPDPANAKAVLASIGSAVELAVSGKVAGIVTNPIQKSTLYKADFPYPGHTEYLAALTGAKTAPVMMLAAEDFRVVPVTVHLSLAAAVAELNTGTITEAGLITANALREDFGIARPRLAVAGLNPHAGEEGAMGSEETQIIAPAVAALQELGIDVFGPVPPDTLFTPKQRESYDAAICMYHDQALIPIKTIAFDRAVNVTLGLPFVRTSPDHGTALDIAGTGKASEESLLAALRLAASMSRHRAQALAA